MRKFSLIVPALFIGMACLIPQSATSTAAASAFDGVELRNGGKVILRHGPTRQINFIKGSRDYTSVTESGGLLTIDKCAKKCPRGYELEIEIVTPQISRVSVRDGGVIETSGTFPAQGSVAAAVSDGGVIDIRALGGAAVTAAVAEGGVIFTRPRQTLVASVSNGGVVTYWGDAQVLSSINGGGDVSKGDADDADKPLREISPPQSAPPAVPSVPAAPRGRSFWW